MFCYHYVLQKKNTNILAQNTNKHQLTNVIYRHNIITIVIIRSLLVSHKLISMYQHEARKQQSTYLTRIYILFNELVNYTVGCMHIGTYRSQINIGLERDLLLEISLYIIL
jgi:hypothetical protein